uniref:Coatomer subunit zeta n=1 Tax=Cyprinodon variegatus TaxID=28743 RepID=A0A3Q2CTM4_CYPVA
AFALICISQISTSKSLIIASKCQDMFASYYDPELYPTMKEQKNFESNVFSKTHKADNEIAFLEGMTIVYKSSIDLFFYVVGSAQENEVRWFLAVILKTAVQIFFREKLPVLL